ncbi:MAG: hypothetical protein HDR50_12040 [Desulfovibrio sp.]|uniref:hypothetical protein n=1 Tax=Desulfovibrio sp. TaxID=885 RepID=UPI001A72D7F6|nr:hypothetical protein [Desulfovibrio sp.]MBD5418342.1 hypothetical protein [Desulfovibrio sp.]
MTSDKNRNGVASNVRLIGLLTEVSHKDSQNKYLLDLYKRHDKYSPDSLVQEIREDASNTLLRPFKGSPNYDEVVRMVAEKIGIKKQELTEDEAENELLILQKMLKDYVKKHPEAEEKLNMQVKEMGEGYTDVLSLLKMNSTRSLLAVASVLTGIMPGIVTAAAIAGPAWRKIVPSVIDIAALRLQQKQEGTPS